MTNYIWPLSRSTRADKMNTSFGPRINRNQWDFHDGIDLPAPIGTNVYAMRDGKVHRAGPGGTDGFTSCHVILEVNDQDDELYLVYVHLHSIADGITVGEHVVQGQLLGTVGEDGAQYPHLHIEFRKGSHNQEDSVHPLTYLPYSDTKNFTAPVADRFNRLDDGLMATRLLFGAKSKLEGDLLRVEIDFMGGATLLESRLVDFNDKDTIHEGNSDENLFTNGIGVEGYQKSDMVKDGRTDLRYGILVRSIPINCDTLVARVIDVKGNIAKSASLPVPNQIVTDEEENFEAPFLMPPDGWDKVESDSGTGTTVTLDPVAAHSGERGMLSIDHSDTENLRQKAGIEYLLPAGRFEWVAKGWFNPNELNLAPGRTIDLLHFRDGSGANLSVATRIFRGTKNLLRAGIIVKNPDGTLSPSINLDTAREIEENTWHEWELHVLRIGTRETTAVLILDKCEELRVNWNSTIYEPRRLRAGIGHSSAGVTATVYTDELRLTESSHHDDNDAVPAPIMQEQIQEN